jgi:6-phosphogluconolactonase (cycloisomerase 2 family)
MRKVIHILSVTVFAMAGVCLISCNKLGDIFQIGNSGTKGYVYTMSNDATKNSILIYKQDINGMLSYGSTIGSGGKGTGAGLGSQGALLLNKSSMFLFAVNAGDNTISSFKVSSDGNLTLIQTVSSGGTTPISLTSFKSWLYVVNGGGNICGFKVSGIGELTMIPGSTQPLSRGDAGPAEILFQPDGSHLIVTEKNTNKICTFKVSSTGVAETSVVNPAYAETPFGFAIAGDNQLIITNAFGGNATQSVITSLTIGSTGITGLSSAVPTLQTSACWIALTKDQDYAYVTNATSATISSLYIGAKNKLELIDPAVAKTGLAPTDIVLSGNAGYIYNMNSASHSISQYQVLPKGRLLSMGEVTGMPAGAVGLAAY